MSRKKNIIYPSLDEKREAQIVDERDLPVESEAVEDEDENEDEKPSGEVASPWDI